MDAASVGKILALASLFLGLLISMVYHDQKNKLSSRSYYSPPVPDGLCSMVEAHSYQCQEYNVSTDDGYILTVHRIPTASLPAQDQPVLYQHGILMDGMSWLLGPTDQSLAFILADNGFDVWIANSRGTRWSRGHTSLRPDEPEYWAWSWDQLAQYDLPTVVNFVYDQTGQKLNYVGYSLGTLIFLASISQHKLVDKVKSAALLCPVAYLSHITTVLGQIAAKIFVGEVTGWFGVVEFNPKIEVVDKFIKALCRRPGIDCYDLIPAFTGKNCCLNASTDDLFVQHEPQATSTMNFVHLAQMIRDGDMRMYDYGLADENMKRYGQKEPPSYNLSNIPGDLPLFLSYGGRDALSDISDVHLLLDALCKTHQGDKLTVHFIREYCHIDFIMGVNAKQMVYDPLVAFFKRQQ